MAILSAVTTTITAFTPVSGAPGTQVRIQGAGFTPVTQVQFNGVNAATFSITDDKNIQATVPKLPDGIGPIGPVSVLFPPNEKVSTSPPNLFEILPSPPDITGFTPMIGTVGTVVDIQGQHLFKVTTVEFNGVPANFTIISAKEIKATVPLGATTGPIRVIGAGGNDNSDTPFVIPMITGISPTSGKVSDPVTIQGGSLGKATGVQFAGGAAGVIISEAGKMIQTKVPSGAKTGVITVSFPGFSLQTPVFTVNS